MVLVDDQTGSVLMNNDLINQAMNRIVCDNANMPRTPHQQRRGARAPTRPPPPASRAARPAARRRRQRRLRPRRRGLQHLRRHRRRPHRADRPRPHRRRHQGAGPDRAALLHRPAAAAPTRTRSGTGSQMYYGTGFAVRRRRGRPRDDPRRHRAHLGPRLLGPVRRDERVDLRHHGRDRRPPERHAGRRHAGRLGARRGRARLPDRSAQHGGPDPQVGDPDRTWQPALRQGESATRLLPRQRRRAHQLRRRQQDVLPGLPGRHVQRADDHRHRRR